MKNCRKCRAELADNARFCHVCGEKTLEETLVCPHCGFENPMQAKFCLSCGMAFTGRPPGRESFDPPFQAPGEQEIADRFFEALKQKVEEEQDSRRWEAYLQCFHQSGFRPVFETRVAHLAETIREIGARSIHPAAETNKLLGQTLPGLADLFLVRYARDINPFPVPEAILKYQDTDPDTLNLFELVMDYLQLEEEEETWYVDFLEMPLEKLKNAGDSFLFPERDERILVLVDQSMFGSAREGFALTDRAIYWKSPLEKAHRVAYREVETIGHEKEWITINGLFFNANPGLNAKIARLLRKLQRIFTV